MSVELAAFSDMVAATGALGVAAMGIAEGLKSVKFDPKGFRKLEDEVVWAKNALKASYGDNYRQTMVSLYRNGRRKGELPRVLRQAVRIGMNEATARTMAEVVGGVDADELAAVATKVAHGDELNDKERNILGRFEVGADARIDAALALAERAYVNAMRFWASVIAIALSFAAAWIIKPDTNGYVTALFVGILAVPIAPIAKDLTKGLQSAAKAIGGRK